MHSYQENIKIECEENCGNSPKKLLLKDVSIALVKNEIDFCMEWMKEEVVWDIIGDQLIQGKENVEKALNEMKDQEVQELRIHNIITHGNTGSVNGMLVRKDKENIAFCDVYNFAGFGKKAKIQKITSYVIHL
ncbi:hypothetical protein ACFPTR_03700 [Aliibacillus thermotolerans]|uniref:DNA-binding protein n=1 Tax=Aliibacillus thermotolerans TaxID=1834418 RepID=A0ABW0U3D9_9BACI|nr:hypothetical protein [Aliibacillus thermotolerans]MDA3129444.1 nuclear transport factor 2 family protein [Aliibacillus thermotolerans]